MALISIPTSIGGVSIPGVVTNGPLGSLYKNPFGRQDLQYPRDLQSATRGHVVNFAINEIDPIKYVDLKNQTIKGFDKAADGIKKTREEVNELYESGGMQGVAQGVADRSAGALKSTFGKLEDGSFTKELNLVLSNRTKTSTKSISLYMPDTLNFTYAASYGQTDLLTAASSVPLVGGVVSAVTQALNNPAARLLLKGSGYALNPNQQVLFDGIDFRTYQLAFTFTPYSKQEAETVASIIKMFKTHAAPRLVEGSGGGMFFVPPSTFTPTFRFNGQINKKISQVAESVIININVDYAPQGFSAHTDGAPVQTTLTIDFRELELITQQKVEQGY
jgi:hypothetical protein